MTTFSPDDFTLGVEEEYQLVDAETGELRSRARHVLAADWSGDIKPELQENTVEIGTQVCADAAAVRRELQRLRFQAAVGAEAHGLRVVAAGTHPFSSWKGQEFTDGAVYRRIREDYRRLAETQNIFGMHIHVSVPEGTDRVKVMNVARVYLPHLLALSASSPFYLRHDTGYASYRTMLWRRWPRSGPPPRMANDAEFNRLLELLLRTERINAPGRLYWDMRPHHDYPTIEFRAADVTPSLEDAVAAAALARAIVAGAVQGVLREPELPDAILDSLLRENAWRAARDGMDAEFVDLATAEPRVVVSRTAILELAAQLGELAGAMGDADTFAMLPTIVARGNAAKRMREEWARLEGDFSALTLWLSRETMLGTGVDRRREQRPDE